MRALRICYVMSGTDRSGGVRVIFEFASRLANRGHTVEILSVRRRRDRNCQNHTWFDFPENVHVRYAPFNWIAAAAKRFLPRIGFPAYEARYVNRLAREIPQSDVVVATYCLTAFPVHRAKRGVGVYHLQHYESLFFPDQEMQRMVEKTYSLPLRKIANCSWLKSKLAAYDDSIGIIWPGIDHDIFRPVSVSRDDDEFRVVALGRKTPWKGLRDLFDAALLVKREIPQMKLILYGNEPNIIAPVPYEYVTNIGDEDLAKLYASADVVVTPSWYESFPLPPLEAMACGAPVVCTPVGTEDYAVDKKNCLIVPPRDPRKLADALLALRNDPSLSSKIKKGGIVTANNFQWENSVDQMERFFKGLL